MAKQIRRYRQNKKAASGTAILACVLAVIVVIAAALLVLTLTGRLDRLLGKKPVETDPPGTEPPVTDVQDTDAPGTDPVVTEPETEPVTEPVTEPPETLPGKDTYVDLTFEDIPNGILVMIDADREYVFPDKSNVTEIYGKKNDCYGLINSTVTLNIEAIEALNRMMEDFYNATVGKGPEGRGISDVIVSGAYRSFEDQKALFDQYGASSTFAPGHTDYHSGYSFYLKAYNKEAGTRELDKAGEAYAWIAENAWKYGFICRYPTAKKAVIGGLMDGTGHYRYVGKAHAAAMYQNNWCLEEYLEYVKDYTYQSPLKVTDGSGTKYEIFYAACDLNSTVRIPVNDKVPYTISGNNYDGFVICYQR